MATGIRSLLDLIAALADRERRAEAAARLAERLGAEALLMLVEDPQLEGVLLPAPGFPPTLPGGPLWRRFLDRCRDEVEGSFEAEVHFPTAATSRRAAAWRLGRAALVVIGDGPLDAAGLEVVLTQLPLLACLAAAEQEAQLAAADAAMARTVARETSELAAALDRARGELHRVLAEQGRLNVALRESERKKDCFLGMLAHELRNPLAAISFSVALARRRGGARESDAARELETVERQTKLLTRMVDDLLDVSRIALGRIELKRVVGPLEQALTRALETACSALQAKELSVQVEFSPEPLVVDGDVARLAQAFTNLLHNAAKFTDRGGRVTVTERREGDHAVVTVVDDGVGIPADVLPTIFELFVQADQTLARSEGGLGIGLSVVQSVVELHGGLVTARSDGPGRGTQVEVRLPLWAGTTPAPEVASSKDAVRSRRTVLVVDDNEDAATSLRELLEVLGHDAHTACSAAGGLEIAERVRPRLVLLDIGLPGMDGFEVARRLRPMLPDTMLVALSGYGAEEKRARARAAGFDEYLVKPVDLTELERLLAG